MSEQSPESPVPAAADPGNIVGSPQGLQVGPAVYDVVEHSQPTDSAISFEERA